MTDDSDFTNIPQAESVPKRRGRLSIVWVIPILAAVVGIGIVVQQYLSEGPTIRIAFRSAEGVEAGKTSIRYKDIEIGKVTGLNLSEDYSRILVTAKMENERERAAREGRQFLDRETARHLERGLRHRHPALRELHPLRAGKVHGERTRLRRARSPSARHFGLPGREFVLRSDTLGSLGIGSPVYYRRLNVGQVISYDLAKDGKSVDIRIFLNAPFDRFVTSNTRFWEASGDRCVGGSHRALRADRVASVPAGRGNRLRDASLSGGGQHRRG